MLWPGKEEIDLVLVLSIVLIGDVETPAFKLVLSTLLLDNDKSYMFSSLMRDLGKVADW